MHSKMWRPLPHERFQDGHDGPFRSIDSFARLAMDGHIGGDRRVALSRNQGRSDSAIVFYSSCEQMSARTQDESQWNPYQYSRRAIVSIVPNEHIARAKRAAQGPPVDTLAATLG